jgi:dienelactone hydrolase
MAERYAGQGFAAFALNYLAYDFKGTAGHQICGDGTYPGHLWAEASSDPRRKDPQAERAAAADAWTRIAAFLKRRL